MTGRRAVRQWDERLSRALQFVPGHVGGRVASAQPIRRRGGTLRQASVGAGGSPIAAPPAEGVFADYVDQAGTGVLTLARSGSLFAGGTFAPAAGDVAVSVIGVQSGTITLPSGWTSLASGTVGGLTYRVGYKVLVGSDDFDATISPGFTYAFPWVTDDGYADYLTWIFTGPTAATPQVSVTTHAATASASFVAPGAGWDGATNGWVAARATPDGGSVSPTVSGDFNKQVDIIGLGQAFDTDRTTPRVATGSASFSPACDVVMFALGFA